MAKLVLSLRRLRDLLQGFCVRVTLAPILDLKVTVAPSWPDTEEKGERHVQ